MSAHNTVCPGWRIADIGDQGALFAVMRCDDHGWFADDLTAQANVVGLWSRHCRGPCPKLNPIPKWALESVQTLYAVDARALGETRWLRSLQEACR